MFMKEEVLSLSILPIRNVSIIQLKFYASICGFRLTIGFRTFYNVFATAILI